MDKTNECSRKPPKPPDTHQLVRVCHAFKHASYAPSLLTCRLATPPPKKTHIHTHTYTHRGERRQVAVGTKTEKGDTRNLTILFTARSPSRERGSRRAFRKRPSHSPCSSSLLSLALRGQNQSPNATKAHRPAGPAPPLSPPAPLAHVLFVSVSHLTRASLSQPSRASRGPSVTHPNPILTPAVAGPIPDCCSRKLALRHQW